MTRYTYRTTITVTVNMADDGEVSEEDGEVTRWARPEDQEESAREWANQAMPLHETYEESWVSIDCPPLALVKSEPTPEPEDV